MRVVVQIVLSLLVLSLGAFGIWLINEYAPKPAEKVQEVVAPAVEVQAIRKQDVRLGVRTHGTVLPRTEIALVPEVSGRVVRVAPSFAAGGFFAVDEELVRLDSRDFELAVTSADAEVVRADTALTWELAEAAAAVVEWKKHGMKEPPPPLVRREPQVAQARAVLAAAQAGLEKAKLDLARTKIVAPFAGRVRNKHVDQGQFVTRGVALAQIYAVDYAEVRLPLPDAELAFLGLPLDYRGEGNREATPPGAPGGGTAGPAVTLTARFAGATHEWQGHIVRVEGQIDVATRMVHAVARVDDPYARSTGAGNGDDATRPPLAVGMFVQAEIAGHLLADIVVVPRSAVRPGDEVLIVDGDDRLRIRKIEVLRRERTRVLVRSGLNEGERLCTSPLETVADGMSVRPIEPFEASERRPAPGR